MASLKGFVTSIYYALKWTSAGNSLKDKIELFLCLSVTLFPRFLRARFSYYNTIIRIIKTRFLNIIIRSNDTKYSLVDYESLFIIFIDEPWMTQFLKVEQNQTFLDVGANIGKYSLFIARRTRGPVIAVEPHPQNYRALLRGIALNKLTNVIPLNVAAWNRSEQLTFYLDVGSQGHSVKWRSERNCGCLTVRGEPLDTMLMQIGVKHIDWVKLDIEGAELEAMLGLESTILRDKPRIIFESKRDLYKPITKQLEKYGYTCCRIVHEYYMATPLFANSGKS